KGKSYVAKELAKQETLNGYTQLDVEDVPSHLDYFGKQQWKRIVPLLNELPIAEHDRDLVENWCMLYSNRRKLQRDVQKNGPIIMEEDEEGNIISRKRNPSFSAFMEVVKEMRSLSGKLGLSVDSRLDMVQPEEKEEEDHFLKLLKKS